MNSKSNIPAPSFRIAAAWPGDRVDDRKEILQRKEGELTSGFNTIQRWLRAVDQDNQLYLLPYVQAISPLSPPSPLFLFQPQILLSFHLWNIVSFCLSRSLARIILPCNFAANDAKAIARSA